MASLDSALALPLDAWLYLREGISATADQLIDRIGAAFPEADIDWVRGDRAVQKTIDDVTRLGVPEPIIAPARRQFGHTARVSVSFPQWPGKAATFFIVGVEPQASDAIRVTAIPFELEMLKYAALQIGKAVNRDCSLQSDFLRRGICSRSLHGVVGDVTALARRHYRTSNYPIIHLEELGDCKRTIHSAALAWFADPSNESMRAKTLAGFGSPAEYADALVAELAAIGPVRRIWSITMPAPLRGALLLDQHDWHTSINLKCNLATAAT